MPKGNTAAVNNEYKVFFATRNATQDKLNSIRKVRNDSEVMGVGLKTNSEIQSPVGSRRKSLQTTLQPRE